MGGKYSTYNRGQQAPTKRREPHPIWRGVGFALMILTPILGWFGSLLLVQENIRQRWVPIPADLIWGGSDPLLLVKILVALVLMLLLFAFFQLVTFLLVRIFGGSRYGPYDAPQVAYRGKHHNR
ncbi:MAG TPA: hypothetical protein VFF68_07350 [Anaerolineaceae bacterium]|nr:hypothetical protein [Anaerolineaceae bacterium]